MAGVRALPDLVARIVLNTTGLKAAAAEAQAAGSYMSGGLAQADKAATGLGSSLAGLNLPLLAAGIAATGLVVAGKSMLEISDKWEAAHKGLAQATKATGASYSEADRFINAFIGSNRRFVQSQSEVVDAYAELTRSGLSQKEVQRDLNIALDLAAIRHSNLSDQIGVVIKAEHGRMKGLIDLGIVTKDQIDAQGNLIAGSKGIAAAMDALEKKTKNGRQTTSDLTQAQNNLSNIWQSLSTKVGPVLVTALTKILNLFSDIADEISTVVGWIQTLISWLGKIDVSKIPVVGGIVAGASQRAIPAGTHVGRRAAGGPVVPDSVYMVGERGPELFSPSTAGTITPHGAGGATVNVTVMGSVVTERQLTLAIREGIRRLDRAQT